MFGGADAASPFLSFGGGSSGGGGGDDEEEEEDEEEQEHNNDDDEQDNSVQHRQDFGQREKVNFGDVLGGSGAGSDFAPESNVSHDFMGPVPSQPAVAASGGRRIAKGRRNGKKKK
jgi:hypothetical protein